MFSQPCPRSGQLIPVKIDRVRDPKTCLRTNRAAFTHLCEFVRFDPAILEKSCENLPACWTVVKWSLLTCSIYPVKIHAGAKLKLNPLPVTRKFVADRTEKRRIDVTFRSGLFLLRPKRAALSRAAFQVCRHSRPRELITVLRALRSSHFSVAQAGDIAKAGVESRLYFGNDIRKLANIGFEIGTPDNQACRIL